MKIKKTNWKFLYNTPIKIVLYKGIFSEIKEKFLKNETFIKSLGKTKKGITTVNTENNTINIYIIESKFYDESILAHEIIHAADGIYQITGINDIDLKPQIVRFLWDNLSSKNSNILEYSKSTDILKLYNPFIKLELNITKDNIDFKEEKESIYSLYRDKEWIVNVSSNGLIKINCYSNKSIIAEALYSYILDLFSKLNIEGSEIRAYTMEALWKELIKKED